MRFGPAQTTRLLVGLAIVLLAGFAWWIFSQPDTPNVSGRIPPVASNDPKLGNPKAAVTIIEYGDFQCEYCQAFDASFKSVQAQYGDQIRLVWKDWPVTSLHPQAVNAAIAARCAQKQNKFWEYHDALFQNQSELTSTIYTQIANTLQLNADSFSRCLVSDGARQLVSDTYTEGLAYGVSQTPTLFIGQYVLNEAPDAATLSQLVASLLKP